jgi:hypothetical protein
MGVVEGLGTLRALTTGLQGVSGELVGIQNQAKATGRALTGMKVVGATAALGLGLAIGKMINDIWLAPERARRERKTKGAEEAAFQASANVARIGTLEEQEAALANLKKERADLPELTPFQRGKVYELFGESPKERRDRILSDIGKSEEKLRRSIAEKSTQRELELEQEYGIPAEISRPTGLQGGQSIQSTNIININATGVSAEEVTRVTKREIKSAERRTLKELKTSQRSIAPAEQ